MNKWFIQITSKEDSFKLTIYEDGTVYGEERGKKLAILNSNAMGNLENLINENMFMFRKLKYYKEDDNPFILRVNNLSKKHYTIKIMGWSQMPRIFNILRNKKNYTDAY